MPALIATALLSATLAGPHYLEEQFEIPGGFRIYRAAGADLTGGSYDITFDAQGRLLVGDGTQIRRLTDTDGDGVFDRREVLTDGLGPRGPQGLLVVGDRLFAVGGDGIQMYDGYTSERGLVHRGRIGAPFDTGGDHSAHTILRGHDGYLYFITGDGGGTRDRLHITEKRSPALIERACSVFRISPDGRRWECVGAGGRNAPNLGMNYLGELFSLDSDMEWHVDLPWWRPVRLHHWLSGGDQGWQGVGAYPPYYIDCLPGIYDVGRGSPDWGVFYEHTQWPEKYHDAYLVCDYLSKSATTGGYTTTGRLFAFFLRREGAGWTASMEVFARPKPGARDGEGEPIQFGLVDIDVAPDGSVFLSDHNQGVWRILYDPDGTRTADGAPSIAPQSAPVPTDADTAYEQLLSLPQPAAEWSRVREEALRERLGDDVAERLQATVLDADESLRRRLRAIRLLAPEFTRLRRAVLEPWTDSAEPEIRGQAAWLLGLRGSEIDATLLAVRLLNDADPFVRRRAAEGLARSDVPAQYLPFLVARLGDEDRLVRYAAMIALGHHDPDLWFDEAVASPEVQIRMRGLVAADTGSESLRAETVRAVIGKLLADVELGDDKENALDVLRIVGRFRGELHGDEGMRDRIADVLLAGFPQPDRDIRWEAARLLGEYRIGAGFGPLLAELEREDDPVAQFHLAQALSRIPNGWVDSQQERAVAWFVDRQRGWFTEFANKGLQFPQFWATILAEFARHHDDAVLARLADIDLSGQLGEIALDLLASSPEAADQLQSLFERHIEPLARARIARALGSIRRPRVAASLRDAYRQATELDIRGALLRGLANQEADAATQPLLIEGLSLDDGDVFRDCAEALLRYDLEPDETLCRTVLSRMDDRRDCFASGQRLLAAIGKVERPGARSGQRRWVPDNEWRAGMAFWRQWYAKRFDREFEPMATADGPEKSDAAVHAFLLSDRARSGNANAGQRVYTAAQCAKCHGAGPGSDQAAAIFGPDLAGVTRRLNRQELADSLVYPSKTVADRFKGVVIHLASGLSRTGFVTDQNDEAVTLVDEEGVHRIPRDEIEGIAPQTTSLMPDRLLNRLSWSEIRDLMTYLEDMGTGAEVQNPTAAGR